MADRITLQVEIGNLTEPQAMAIQEMFGMWMQLSGIGSSRNVSFFADGDGNFHPKISVDGRAPTRCEIGGHWDKSEDTYSIDFDEIAWALRAANKQPEASA